IPVPPVLPYECPAELGLRVLVGLGGCCDMPAPSIPAHESDTAEDTAVSSAYDGEVAESVCIPPCEPARDHRLRRNVLDAADESHRLRVRQQRRERGRIVRPELAEQQPLSLDQAAP